MFKFSILLCYLVNGHIIFKTANRKEIDSLKNVPKSSRYIRVIDGQVGTPLWSFPFLLMAQRDIFPEVLRYCMEISHRWFLKLQDEVSWFLSFNFPSSGFIVSILPQKRQKMNKYQVSHLFSPYVVSLCVCVFNGFYKREPIHYI